MANDCDVFIEKWREVAHRPHHKDRLVFMGWLSDRFSPQELATLIDGEFPRDSLFRQYKDETKGGSHAA